MQPHRPSTRSWDSTLETDIPRRELRNPAAQNWLSENLFSCDALCDAASAHAQQRLFFRTANVRILPQADAGGLLLRRRANDGEFYRP
jgi:hypothetical protein